MVTIEVTAPLELIYETAGEALEVASNIYEHALESGLNPEFSVRISKVKEVE
jgi:hypothetical protein